MSEEPQTAEATELTYEDLKQKTVVDLRDIAREKVKGYSQMNKEQLLLALCEALGIEAHAQHQVVGVDKSAIKSKIRALKVERNAALEAHDHAQLKLVRRRIHRLKRRLHKATV